MSAANLSVRFIGRGTLARRSGLLLAHDASFNSTVRIPSSSRARPGSNRAIDVGSPMCRRSVPIWTTSSSPFLNSPSVGLRGERHPQPHDVVSVLGRERVGTFESSGRRWVFARSIQRIGKLGEAFASDDLVRRQRDANDGNGRKILLDLREGLLLRSVPLREETVAHAGRQHSVDDDPIDGQPVEREIHEGALRLAHDHLFRVRHQAHAGDRGVRQQLVGAFELPIQLEDVAESSDRAGARPATRGWRSVAPP